MNTRARVVVITHDRFFLDNVVGWMLEIWHGKTIPYEGNYSQYLIQRAKRMQLSGSAGAARVRSSSIANSSGSA
jgi:ATPase subunit of ABC transporter with duplicated ATPase domains